MGMVAILAFIEEPAVCPDLGGPKNLLAGSQNNPHRFVVECKRKGCHAHGRGKTLAAMSPCYLSTYQRVTVLMGSVRVSQTRSKQAAPCRADAVA